MRLVLATDLLSACWWRSRPWDRALLLGGTRGYWLLPCQLTGQATQGKGCSPWVWRGEVLASPSWRKFSAEEALL